jgi:ubiquinone/menaquinone biosynthesis C-methylase UbiE
LPQKLSPSLSLVNVLEPLKAMAEETRLRILALLKHGELSVTDITEILAQSQPRISRHLKLLADAGVIKRSREGAWVFYRLMAPQNPLGSILHHFLAMLSSDDPVLSADALKLTHVRQVRDAAAFAYFEREANNWDQIRSLYAADEVVENTLREVISDKPIRSLLDLGTGTGRMLMLFASQAQSALGIDTSPAMLALARAHLLREKLTHVELRQGDLFALPQAQQGNHKGYDLIILNHVLHFLEDPARALKQAASQLSAGGRLLVIDFAPHSLEFLRERHAHRRLGFSHEQMQEWFTQMSLALRIARDVSASSHTQNHLTVSIWLAQDQRIAVDTLIQTSTSELA